MRPAAVQRPDAEERPDATGVYSSPPCFLHELDPSYLGYLGPDETVRLLNELLEAERAGAKVVRVLAETSPDPDMARQLRKVARDEARFCVMLRRHIQHLGGVPTHRTGAFHDKVMALAGQGPRIRLLNRGQDWVVRRIRDALPRIGSDALHRDLRDMLEVHRRNIEDCGRL